MRSKVKRFAGLSIPLASTLCLASCGFGEVEETRWVSPGGHYAATLKVKSCGAMCAPSATVILHDLENRLGKDDIEVFDGVGGWPVELHWIGPRTMVVTFCEGSRFKVRSDLPEEEASEDGEPYPRVTVLVVNDKKMVIDGKAYCRFPNPSQAGAAPKI